MDNSNNSSTVSYELPPAAIAFSPAFLTELVVGLVSNALLFALLVKARKVQNNTNVFLFAMVAANVLSLFPTLAMALSSVKRKWILGEGACTVSRFVVAAIQLPNLMLHAFISRDRYHAVIHFFQWNPYTRRTYLAVALVWVLAAAFGGIGALAGGAGGNVGRTNTTLLSCLVPGSSYSTTWVVLFFLAGLSLLAVVVVSIVNYAYVLRKLLVVKSIRSHCYACPASTLPAGNAAPVSCADPRDAPIEWRSEIRTLQSICSAFTLNVMAFLIFNGYYASILIKSSVEGRTFEEVCDPVVLSAVMLLYLLPSVNPAVFLILNTKFRRRMRGLLGCEKERPDSPAGGDRYESQPSPDKQRDNTAARHNTAPGDNIIAPRSNKIVPMSPSQCDNLTVPAARTILRNTWVLDERVEIADI